jgi:FKBP-type peptidyl-prolyl cis-trans isomerase SlyD
MQIADNTAVTFHYTLTNDAGETLDSSRGGEPLAYLHGAGNIVPGLEKALTGLKPGDVRKVTVAPAEGYGERAEQLVQKAPRSMFDGHMEPEVGLQFQADSTMGPMVVTVVALDGDTVTLDGNHALAGQTLHFDVEIVGVRAASAEERSHGHIHGPGGHHH